MTDCYINNKDVVCELSAKIREQVINSIESMSDKELADKLGLGCLVVAATMLRERTDWPLDVAVKVATALGLRVSVEVLSEAS